MAIADSPTADTLLTILLFAAGLAIAYVAQVAVRVLTSSAMLDPATAADSNALARKETPQRSAPRSLEGGNG